VKVSLLKTARQSATGGNKGLRLNQKLITFIICIALSAFLWLMNRLSKKYTDVVTFQVQYQHLSKDKKLIPASEIVTIKLITTGYNLMAYNLGIKESLINVDANSFRHKDNEYFYTLQSQPHQEKIQEQLGEQIEMLEINPDSLFLRPAQQQL
jgi:hypothetical protein